MKITDDMLSAQAAEARELWLQACTPEDVYKRQHQTDGIQIDARLGGRNVDRRADQIGFRLSLIHI